MEERNEAEQLWDEIVDADQFPIKRELAVKAIIEALATATEKARLEERENVLKVIEGLDPLLAICDWEDSEEIAHAVKNYIASAIRGQEAK